MLIKEYVVLFRKVLYRYKTKCLKNSRWTLAFKSKIGIQLCITDVFNTIPII